MTLTELMNDLEQYLDDWDDTPDSHIIDRTPNIFITIGHIRELVNQFKLNGLVSSNELVDWK